MRSSWLYTLYPVDSIADSGDDDLAGSMATWIDGDLPSRI